MRRLLPSLGACAVFVLTLSVGIALALQAERLRERDEREAATQAAAGASFSLEQELARSVSATYALDAVLREQGEIRDFDALAARILPLYGGLSTLQLAPGGVIRRCYPLEGNEAVIGYDVLADPTRRDEALEAIRTHRLTVAGPLELKQGGLGLVGRLPVFLPDRHGQERFWGFVNALVRVPGLVEGSRLGQMEAAGYSWRLSRVEGGGSPPVRFAGSTRPLPSPVTVTVDVPNGTWELAVAPAAGWRYAQGSGLRRAIALALAALVAGLAWIVLRQPEVLRRKVDARTEELARANARLAEDVADRRRAEEALVRSEARFRTLIEKATDVILVVDARRRVRFCSPAATELLGFGTGDLLEDDALSRFHPDDLARAREAIRGAAGASGAAVRLALRLRHADGSWRSLEGFARNLLADPLVEGVVLNLGDVTEPQRLRDQLQQAQKLESIGLLAGGVAHDFNNLLTVILAGAGALGESPSPASADDAESIDEIRNAAERARDLTRQLLAFARKQVIAPVPLDLNRLLLGLEKLLRRALGASVELAVDLRADLWPVRCDPVQIEQVVLNLAMNARDAMPRGGRLTLGTSNLVANGAHASLFPGMPPGDYSRLSVRDSGVGMTAEVRERAFEPFYTTKATGQGTGLGLATVYGIVKQSGGHIRVESAPGSGTLFEICFPRTEDPVRPAEPGPERRGAEGTETILLVEDDPRVREVTARALRSGGYRVLVAEGGAAALDVAAREQEPPRMLVTDVVMPGMDGRAVAEELRRRYEGLRVLFVSGYAPDAVGRGGVLEPGVQFLPKPFTPADLLDRVRAVLEAS